MSRWHPGAWALPGRTITLGSIGLVALGLIVLNVPSLRGVLEIPGSASLSAMGAFLVAGLVTYCCAGRPAHGGWSGVVRYWPLALAGGSLLLMFWAMWVDGDKTMRYGPWHTVVHELSVTALCAAGVLLLRLPSIRPDSPWLRARGWVVPVTAIGLGIGLFLILQARTERALVEQTHTLEQALRRWGGQIEELANRSQQLSDPGDTQRLNAIVEGVEQLATELSAARRQAEEVDGAGASAPQTINDRRLPSRYSWSRAAQVRAQAGLFEAWQGALEQAERLLDPAVAPVPSRLKEWRPIMLEDLAIDRVHTLVSMSLRPIWKRRSAQLEVLPLARRYLTGAMAVWRALEPARPTPTGRSAAPAAPTEDPHVEWETSRARLSAKLDNYDKDFSNRWVGRLPELGVLRAKDAPSAPPDLLGAELINGIHAGNVFALLDEERPEPRLGSLNGVPPSCAIERDFRRPDDPSRVFMLLECTAADAVDEDTVAPSLMVRLLWRQDDRNLLPENLYYVVFVPPKVRVNDARDLFMRQLLEESGAKVSWASSARATQTYPGVLWTADGRMACIELVRGSEADGSRLVGSDQEGAAMASGAVALEFHLTMLPPGPVEEATRRVRARGTCDGR